VNDFALIVEDDMELSPCTISTSSASSRTTTTMPQTSSHVYGISFQRQTFVAGEDQPPRDAAYAEHAACLLIVEPGMRHHPALCLFRQCWASTAVHAGQRVEAPPLLQGYC